MLLSCFLQLQCQQECVSTPTEVLLTTKSCPPFPLKPICLENSTSLDEYSPHSSKYRHTYTCTHATEGTLIVEQMGLGSNLVNRDESFNFSEAGFPHLYNGNTQCFLPGKVMVRLIPSTPEVFSKS